MQDNDMSNLPTIQLEPDKKHKPSRKLQLTLSIVFPSLILIVVSVLTFMPALPTSLIALGGKTIRLSRKPTPTPIPKPFDPNVGAVLPNHRIVAFYAIPGAEVTGPAFDLSTQMLQDLQS